MNGCKCDLCRMLDREILFASFMWSGIGTVCVIFVAFIVGALAGWW